jgi:KRAB domain-containing zinc finger protein
MGVHSQEKPFKCTKCPFSARVNKELKEHMKIHVSEKKYKCAECSDFETNSSEKLKNHIEKHSKEKPFRCPKCKYASKVEDNVSKHMEAHLGKNSTLHDCRSFKKG